MRELLNRVERLDENRHSLSMFIKAKDSRVRYSERGNKAREMASDGSGTNVSPALLKKCS